MSGSQKDVKSFKKLYMEHFNALVGFVTTYVKDDDIAMDITQDTFFKLYQRWDTSYTDQNALAFLYITAKNHSMDFLRHSKFKKEDLDGVQDVLLSDDFFLDEITRQETISYLNKSIEQLTGRCLDVAKLSLMGKNNQEIAEELNISINSVKTYKKEMYTKIRKMFENEFVILCVAKVLLQIEN